MIIYNIKTESDLNLNLITKDDIIKISLDYETDNDIQVLYTIIDNIIDYFNIIDHIDYDTGDYVKDVSPSIIIISNNKLPLSPNHAEDIIFTFSRIDIAILFELDANNLVVGNTALSKVKEAVSKDTILLNNPNVGAVAQHIEILLNHYKNRLQNSARNYLMNDFFEEQEFNTIVGLHNNEVHKATRIKQNLLTYNSDFKIYENMYT